MNPGARYDRIGQNYSRYRRPDPRIAAQIERALAGARTVVDVGSGAGSYEPRGRTVVAVEPSMKMIAQRAPDAAPVVRAVAERLPFGNQAFDVALALFTIHHWQDAERGFDELERVAHRSIFFTWDPEVHHRFWLYEEYLPKIPEAERKLPALAEILRRFPRSTVEVVPIPWDCTDGFCTAYWRRPEMFLDPDARAAISPIALLDPAITRSAVERLARDLETGNWQRRHEDLTRSEVWDCGLRLVVAR